MKSRKNIVLEGKHKKPILTDVFYKEDNIQKPIVIFCHGYKGFKDWGAWNLMAEEFSKNNFFFIKFNFSHNGGTVDQPIDFPDLEAFGNNNYTKELDDLKSVIEWIYNTSEFKNEVNINSINLLGHSRAGGIVTIKAEEDIRIKKVITLAGVSDFGSRSSTSGDLEKWKREGVKYVVNGRTKQQMPHFYQFYKDFKLNEKRLTINRAIKNLQIPHLIIHGDNDTSISVEEAKIQHEWNPKSKLEIINGADHVFGVKHPCNSKELPLEFLDFISISIDFLKE